MKRLFIIGGGEWQVPLIRMAKELGYYVVNSNLYKDSPGFEYADVGIVADVLDKEKNLNFGKEFLVDAVLTDQSDIAVPTVAYVAEKLGLPSIGTSVAELFTNKLRMRNHCLKNDFPTPMFEPCTDILAAKKFVDKVGLPVVVKPPANQSSRGVTIVTDANDLSRAFEFAREHSKDGLVLLEEYIGGIELTVEGLKLNGGGHYCLATSFKTHYAHNPAIANRLLYSHSHPEINYDLLRKQHNRLVNSMSLPFGLTHAEYKYYEGKFYLIEIAARGGGTLLSSDVVPLMSNVDTNAILIRMALGEMIFSIEPELVNRIAVLDFLQFHPGRVSHISGVDRAKSIPGVVGLGLNFKVGDIISDPLDDRARHGYVIAQAETPTQLSVLLARVHHTIQVRYE